MQAKKGIVGALLFVSLGFFFCMTLLAGLARPLMTTKLFGSLNVGFFLILVAYLICWGTALLYIRAANGLFDKKVEAIVSGDPARIHQP
ncbi:MAG: hypothetical protein NVSMB28_24780 [Collimonas sp.]